jgi:Protein of unknown function (DUF4065)
VADERDWRITRFRPDEERFPYDETKFYELVLYIADAFKTDTTFGRIKLAKLIFNSDVRAMFELNRPIAGVTYIKDTWGHNPKQLLLAELDLQAAGDAEIVIGEGEEEPRFIAHDERRRLVPRRKPDPQAFTSDERGLIDAVIEEYRTTPAIAMSEESHKTLGWRLAEWHKPIPLETVFVSKPTARDREAGRAVAKRLGLLSE